MALEQYEPVPVEKVTRELIQQRTCSIALDPGTPIGERLRALRMLAEMTPGALVPVGVHHSGNMSIEEFVAAAGGKPDDVKDQELVN